MLSKELSLRNLLRKPLKNVVAVYNWKQNTEVKKKAAIRTPRLSNSELTKT